MSVPSRLVVTGGSGFIGSNFIRWYLRAHPQSTAVNLDKLTYAGRGENLAELQRDPRYRLVVADISDRGAVQDALAGADAIVNFAAETHVDRSIQDAGAFWRTNVLGLLTLMEVIRDLRPARCVHISTDEVYGSLPAGSAAEDGRLLPNSPYAASKAAGDLLIRSFMQTHGVGVIIVRPSNNFGPYQFPEKFIPLCITNLIEGRRVPVYGDGRQIRDWLYVDDCCEAIDMILAQGEEGTVYNVSPGNERENMSVVQDILARMHRSESDIEWVRDRPGHDRRYSTRSDRVRMLGWTPKTSFGEGLDQTIRWYQTNEAWWRPLRDKAFQDYYRRQYVPG